jgi:uncharacterized protein with PIN domain
MSNNLKRKLQRKASKDLKKSTTKELQNKLKSIFLPDACSLCNKTFDKKSREMAMNWMVVAKDDKKALVCPSCWDKTSSK